MTPAAVTADLPHHLLTGSHAEGITALAVAAAVHHDTRVLLLAGDRVDFTESDTRQLPGGPVLPSQSLTDALDPVAAAIGLSIAEITGHLGHHDHIHADEITGTFSFSVIVTDADAICRSGGPATAGPPVNLRDALTGIDAHNADLVTRAVLHANGRRPSAHT